MLSLALTRSSRLMVFWQRRHNCQGGGACHLPMALPLSHCLSSSCAKWNPFSRDLGAPHSPGRFSTSPRGLSLLFFRDYFAFHFVLSLHSRDPPTGLSKDSNDIVAGISLSPAPEHFLRPTYPSVAHTCPLFSDHR